MQTQHALQSCAAQVLQCRLLCTEACTASLPCCIIAPAVSLTQADYSSRLCDHAGQVRVVVTVLNNTLCRHTRYNNCWLIKGRKRDRCHDIVQVWVCQCCSCSCIEWDHVCEGARICLWASSSAHCSQEAAAGKYVLCKFLLGQGWGVAWDSCCCRSNSRQAAATAAG